MRLDLGTAISSLSVTACNQGSQAGSAAPAAAFSVPTGAVIDWNAGSLALKDGDPVASWRDDLAGVTANAAGSNKPIFVADAMGGKQGVRFTGLAGCEMLAAATGVLADTFASHRYTVAVITADIQPAANGTLFAAASNATNGVWVLGSGTQAGSYNYKRAHGGSNALSIVTQTSDNTDKLFPVSSAGSGAQRFYVNGSCFYCYPGQGPAYTGANFAIGSRVGAFFAKSTIMRILIWDRDLSPAEVLQLQFAAEADHGQAVARPENFIVFDGDSITAGVGAQLNSEYSYPGIVASGLGRPLGSWTNVAVPSATTEDMTGLVHEIADIAGVVDRQMIVSAFEWYNQPGGGISTNPIRAYNAAVKAAVPGALTVIGSSTAAGARDTADDTRMKYNLSLDADHGAFDAYVAIHEEPEIGVRYAASASDPNASTFFQNDRVHLTGNSGDSGYRRLAAMFKTAIAMLS